jgi:chaperone BCS1
MIKAIGNQTGRHIVNMKIRPTSTQKQIFNMFFSDKIKVLDGQKIEELVIPLDKRIYVLEDIDCLSSIVFQRSETQESENEKKKKEDAEKEKMRRSKEVDFGRPDEIDKSPEINLSFLLNLLDGVLETPGRILIMTSNCPEKLDKALVRPGRVDINVRLGYCSVDTVQKMFNSFFECDSFVFEDIPIRDITPAIVQSILCNNIYDPKGAYNELLKTMTHIPDSPESMKSREMASFNVSGDNVSGDKKTSDSDSEVSESKSKLKYIINI